MPEPKQRKSRTRLSQDARKTTASVDNELSPESPIGLPYFTTMSSAFEAWRHWVKTGSEMSQFYNRRLAKDYSYFTQLAQCRTPADYLAVWSGMTSEAAHDYADEVDRVLAINIEGVADNEFDSRE